MATHVRAFFTAQHHAIGVSSLAKLSTSLHLNTPSSFVPVARLMISVLFMMRYSLNIIVNGTWNSHASADSPNSPQERQGSRRFHFPSPGAKVGAGMNLREAQLICIHSRPGGVQPAQQIRHLA